MGVRYHFLVPIHWPKPWTHPRGPSFALVPLQTAAPRLRSGRRRCRPRRPSPPPRSPTRRSPPPPTPSAVADPDPAARRRRRARRPCRLCRCPPGHQAAVASATLVYALSLSDAAAQGHPPASSATGPPAASPTSPSIAATQRHLTPPCRAAPTVPAGIALASIGASAATGATASAAAGAPAAAAPAAAPMSSSLSSEVS